MFKLTKAQRRVFFPILSLCLILSGTYLAIQFAKGYRPTLTGLKGTGLLAANSFPPGAEVYLNNRLSTATDDTLNLTPGNYLVSLKKDGFTPWTKSLVIKAELVTQTNATLFRTVQSLAPLTLSGATNINPSPDGLKIAYTVASASATAKNGLYVLELSSTPLSLQNRPRQIAKNSPNLDFAQADLLWSPNSSQILAHFGTHKETGAVYLLSADNLNDLDNLPEVTARLPVILAEWEEDIYLRENKQFALLPDEFKAVATQSATNLYFSPDENRILYTTTAYYELPNNLLTPPPSSSTQPEERNLQVGGVYVYDLIEDKNFRIGSIANPDSIESKRLLTLLEYQQSIDSADNISTPASNPNPITFDRLYDPQSLSLTLANFRQHYSSIHTLAFQWYPNSTHIIIKEANQVDVIEYDATNRATIYAGPNSGDFVYPWPDGSKLIILTNLSASLHTPGNLYAVDIR